MKGPATAAVITGCGVFLGLAAYEYLPLGYDYIIRYVSSLFGG